MPTITLQFFLIWRNKILEWRRSGQVCFQRLQLHNRQVCREDDVQHWLRDVLWPEVEWWDVRDRVQSKPALWPRWLLFSFRLPCGSCLSSVSFLCSGKLFHINFSCTHRDSSNQTNCDHLKNTQITATWGNLAYLFLSSTTEQDQGFSSSPRIFIIFFVDNWIGILTIS